MCQLMKFQFFLFWPLQILISDEFCGKLGDLDAVTEARSAAFGTSQEALFFCLPYIFACLAWPQLPASFCWGKNNLVFL